MMQWINAVQTCTNAGQGYVVITVLGTRGSTPRNSGTKMVVSLEQSFCTIGGGNLEFKAVETAKTLLSKNKLQQTVEYFPLGAKAGQCCGGSVVLLFEAFPSVDLSISLFGAGHVGKALVKILEDLPYHVTWVDSRPSEFPEGVGANVRKVFADNVTNFVSSRHPDEFYIIMTHKHALDFEILEAILKRNDAKYVGLIGSQTKWRHFRSRFQHKGYDTEFYKSVSCPVGVEALSGKRPMEVAISIAAQIMMIQSNNEATTTSVHTGVDIEGFKVLANSLKNKQGSEI